MENVQDVRQVENESIINFQVLSGMNDLFSMLNPMERWGSVKHNSSYNQMTKQAQNCITLFFLAKEYERKTGEQLDWTKFPKITIFRAFKNVFATADVPGNIIKRTLEKAGKDNTDMDALAFSKMEETTSKEFTDFIKTGLNGIELDIYDASSKISTLVELMGISTADVKFKKHKRKSVLKEIKEYKHIPGMKTMMKRKMLKNLQKIAKLRYQNRWSTYLKLVKCSVLGHLFDTAIFAYFISLEVQNAEEKATKAFFLGVFHDLAELLTKDMPSTTKDGIKGYRSASEEVEEELMEEELYPCFSNYLANCLREMYFESDENSELRQIIKGADYLSAASEINRQVEAGTRYSPYLEALLGHERKFQSGVATLSPNGRMLYRKICETAYKMLFNFVPEKKVAGINDLMDSVRNN